MPVFVESVRRYPVKSMGGEYLDTADVDRRGIVGDRWYAVVDGDRRLASGKDSRRFRRRDAVFGYAARTDASGRVVVETDGSTWPVGAEALDAALSAAMGDVVRVLPEDDIPHHDAEAVSIVGTATLRWCAEQWGDAPDGRRIRVNVVVTTQEPFEERAWVGHEVGIGSATLRVTADTPRCRMIDLTQDGVAPAARWLKPLTQANGGLLAVYAEVARPGTIAVGDVVDVR